MLGIGLFETARGEPLSEEVERLDRQRTQLLSEQRYAEALNVTRLLLGAYEQHFGLDHWRSRALREAMREYEVFAGLSPEQLKDLFRLKSPIEQEIKTGISYRSVDGLAQLREQIKVLVGNGPSYLELTRALLTAHFLRNELENAEELAREYTVPGKSIGESSPFYADGIVQLGFVLASRGELSEAAQLLTNGTELNLAHYGPSSLPFLDGVNRLAFLKLRQGKTVEALLLSGAAVSGYPRAMKTGECKVALAHFTWGMANAALQRKTHARSALRQFVELSNGYMVPDHPLMLEAAAHLKRLEESPRVEWLEKQSGRLEQEAAHLFSEQRYAESVEASRSLLKLYEQNLGADHFRCEWLRATIRENERLATLSGIERTQFFQLKSRIENEYENRVSVDDLARLREQVKELIGDHGVYHQLTEAIIVSLYSANDLRRAEQVAHELRGAGKSIGDSSSELGRALSHLGFLQACQGKLKEAGLLVTKGVEINYLHCDTQELFFLDSINRLAYVRLRQGQTVEALVISGAAMSSYKRAMKTEECEVPSAFFTWGMANLALGQKDEARRSLERFIEFSKGYLVPDHPMVLEAQAAVKRLQDQMHTIR
jgi:hypothetical protein